MTVGAGTSLRGQEVVLFTEAEHVVLSKWFEQEETRRSCAHGAEIDRALDELGIPDEGHDDVLGRVDVAVARILLETDEELLPNWWHTENDGTEVSGRRLRTTEEKPRRKVALRSQHVLTINWADSGPGFSWPEAYRLVWVPGYERYVLTVSNDSGPTPDCADAAMGAFAADRGQVLEHIGRFLKGHWGYAASCGQEAWVYCFTAGLASEAQALAWRDEVWPENTEA